MLYDHGVMIPEPPDGLVPSEEDEVQMSYYADDLSDWYAMSPEDLKNYGLAAPPKPVSYSPDL